MICCPDCFDKKGKFIKLISGIVYGRWMCSVCDRVWDVFYTAQIKFDTEEKNKKWLNAN